MKISPEKWHYKVLEWAYGQSFFWKWVKDATGEYVHVRKQVSLCPYVDRLITALVLSPFIAIYKAASYNLRRIMWVAGLGFTAPLIVAVIDYLTGAPINWWIFLLGEIIIWGVFGALELMAKLGLFDVDTTEKKKKKPVEKKHEPSLLFSWLEARHRKVCPILEFE